jgi:hypothetical protein
MSAKIIEMNPTGPDSEAFRQWERDEVASAIRRNAILVPSDRKKVALNLARKLDGVADKRGSKTRIVHLAWPHDDAPLKRLDLVTLPPEPSQTRLARLAKKPKHYAALAKAIARVSGDRQDDACVEVFRGTRIEAGIAERAEKFSDDHSEDWDKLAESIEAMAAAVAKRTGLREHLRTMASRLGNYSLATETIRPSGSYLLPHGPLANGYELWDQFPPIPSVPLVEKSLTDPFERAVKLLDPNGTPRVIPVTVFVGREVRLAIGPADDTETPRPMFEIRTVVRLVDGDGRNWANCRKWFYLEGGVERFTVEDEQGNEVDAEIDLGSSPGVEGRWVPLVENQDGAVVETSLALKDRDTPRPRQWEHVYAMWRPVTSVSCADILGARLSEDWRLTFDIADTRHATFLPNDIIGGWVETALIDGDRVLENALEADAERLVALVRNYIINQRGQAEANHRRALAEWANEREEKVEDNG